MAEEKEKIEAHFIKFPLDFIKLKIEKNLTPDQAKIADFIYRRVKGFCKPYDHISNSQFTNGITSKIDGKVLNRGTGLALGTVIKCLRALIAKKVINTHLELCRRDIGKAYSINLDTNKTDLFLPIPSFVVDHLMPLLTSIQWAVYVYVKYCRQWLPGEKLSSLTIAKSINCTERAVRLALKKLNKYCLLDGYQVPEFLELNSYGVLYAIEQDKTEKIYSKRKQNKPKDTLTIFHEIIRESTECRFENPLSAVLSSNDNPLNAEDRHSVDTLLDLDHERNIQDPYIPGSRPTIVEIPQLSEIDGQTCLQVDPKDQKPDQERNITFNSVVQSVGRQVGHGALRRAAKEKEDAEREALLAGVKKWREQLEKGSTERIEINSTL